MNIPEQKLKEILLRESYVTQGDIEKAEEYAKTHHVGITDYLITAGLLTKDLLGQAIAEAYGVPYANLQSRQPSTEQVLKIPAGLARKYRIVLYEENETQVGIATDNPTQKGLLEELAPLFPKKIVLFYGLSDYIESFFLYYRKPQSCPNLNDT